MRNFKKLSVNADLTQLAIEKALIEYYNQFGKSNDKNLILICGENNEDEANKILNTEYKANNGEIINNYKISINIMPGELLSFDGWMLCNDNFNNAIYSLGA